MKTPRTNQDTFKIRGQTEDFENIAQRTIQFEDKKE